MTQETHQEKDKAHASSVVIGGASVASSSADRGGVVLAVSGHTVGPVTVTTTVQPVEKKLASKEERAYIQRKLVRAGAQQAHRYSVEQQLNYYIPLDGVANPYLSDPPRFSLDAC